MDSVRIINYTRLSNLTMLLLGLLQPGNTIALPALEGEPDLKGLLPYLKQSGIEIQWYHEEELAKPPQKSSLTDVLLLPVEWAAYFPALCEYQKKESTMVLLNWTDLGEPQVDRPETMGVMQIEMYNKSLKVSNRFFASYSKDLKAKLQRLSCYDMVEIPIFPKNDR